MFLDIYKEEDIRPVIEIYTIVSMTDKGKVYVYPVFTNKMLQYFQKVQIKIRNSFFQVEILVMKDAIHLTHYSLYIKFISFTDSFLGLNGLEN